MLNATGLCRGAAAALGADATLGRYRRAKFVFSPRGEGCSNYREFEALYAGAIPVVDVDPGAGRSEFWANMPHVPAVYPATSANGPGSARAATGGAWSRIGRPATSWSRRRFGT